MKLRLLASVTAIIWGSLGLIWAQQAGPGAQPAAEPEEPATHPDWSHLPPVTAQTLQYDKQGPYQLFNRPSKNQGLDTMLGRGRVAPEELLAAALTPPKKRERERTRDSARTIFHDQYTGAEVWRISNFPFGVVRHSYSGVPAWNANGRYIALDYITHGNMLFDQEKCTLHFGLFKGEWSPTEPNTMYSESHWQDGRAVVVFDVAQEKVLRPLGPVRTDAGLSPISPDGKWACWREGSQDAATTFGLAATDGSSYKSISIDGGIVAEQTPVTFQPLPPPPTREAAKGFGIHQMYFTKNANNSVVVNVLQGSHASQARIISTDGKMGATFDHVFVHMGWEPSGKYVIHLKKGVLATDPVTKATTTIADIANIIEGHSSWNDADPNWIGLSYRTTFAGELMRLSMRDDHSIARLCGSCPANPETTAYNNDEFGCISPDGTKVLFMSTMSGSVNEYLVVAANPHAPKLAGQWKDQGYELTITPDAVSRETKEYRIYRTAKSGQDYQQVALVQLSEAGPVSGAPITFTVKDLAKDQGAFFAVRAQEWSGLLSRYSNDVSSDAKPTAAYIEPQLLNFTGYLQGFDPQGAGDIYYLFVPKDGTPCAVALENPQKEAQVYARVAGKDVAFRVNGKAVAKTSYADWTWVSLGSLSGSVKIESSSVGFKLDRIFITPNKDQAPAGKGLDFHDDPAFVSAQPEAVAVKTESPFALEVAWKAIPAARYYNLYAADKPDFVPSQSNLVYSPPVGTERVIDWGLKPGTNYYYKVVAVDYDGAVSKPSSPVQGKTGDLAVQSVEVPCASAAGAPVEDDKSVAGSKAVLLDKGKNCKVTFNVAADGDYVIWHDFRADDGKIVSLSVTIDDGKPRSLTDTYDLTSLHGKALGHEWVWSRFTFRSDTEGSGVIHLKAGPHTLEISSERPIHLDKLIVTNDQSLWPPGRLCTF